jgi:hypothetical protein
MKKAFLKLRYSHDEKYQNIIRDADTEPDIVSGFNIAITARAKIVDLNFILVVLLFKKIVFPYKMEFRNRRLLRKFVSKYRFCKGGSDSPGFGRGFFLNGG